MDWITHTLQQNPAIAIFLVIGIGFLVGRIHIGSFSLGTVTSVLLTGVVVGQLNIPVPGPVKSVFFLMFLFAVGYSVGPQFFTSLKGDGLKQVLFAVVMSLLVMGTTLACALVMGYNPGEAVGLMAGAQTSSACIGVGSDAINTLSGVDEATRTSWIHTIPVAYAVCYIFGTMGSAYLLANIAPRLLGGIDSVRRRTAALEAQLNQSSHKSDPAFESANRQVVFRAYRVDAPFFNRPRRVSDIEEHLAGMNRTLYVERVRRPDNSIVDVQPDTRVALGDIIVLSGRRHSIITDESWIGAEVNDPELLDFPVMKQTVLVNNRSAGMDIDSLRSQDYMHGIVIESVTRNDIELPILARTTLEGGDLITLVGWESEVRHAARSIGIPSKNTTASDIAFIGLGIFVGALLGVATIHLGGIPLSLSTSGGALIAGLLLGWLRSRRPSFGFIPRPAVWFMNNLGLNVFIAVVGITAGPTFITGLQQIGVGLLLTGIVATSVPLLLGVVIGDKLFHFNPAITLGCVAGARTTTAGLGAIQERIGSTLPAMGYTVTYAIGSTCIILWSVILVMLISL